MALIKCPDCQREHSDLATACPGCGRPTPIGKPVVIEQTAKRWKDVQVTGVLVSLVALFLLFTELRGLGIALGVVAVGLFVYARYNAWYHHG